MGKIIAFLLYFLFGAVDISAAIENYQSKRYFRFGVDIMLASIMMILIAKLYFT